MEGTFSFSEESYSVNVIYVMFISGELVLVKTGKKITT